jgi:hypothetical protein
MKHTVRSMAAGGMSNEGHVADVSGAQIMHKANYTNVLYFVSKSGRGRDEFEESIWK